MKVEKEVLIKQHFWILLAVLIPLVLICLIVLWTATASAIEGKKKDYEKSVKDVQAISKPKNQKWLDALKVREDEVAKQKTVIWGEAWQRQKDLLTWPEGLPAADRQQLEKLYFGDPIDWKVRDNYGKPDGPYAAQFPPVVSIVTPVDEKGQGMVQFRGGWEAILHPFDWTKKEIKPPPDSEDLWVLQEDLAVYRELLRIIKDVNELIATFHKAPPGAAPKPDKSKGEIDRQIFTNPTWKLDLAVAEEKNKKFFRCQITNVSHRRQPLGIFFMIKIKGIDDQNIFVDGEPLAPGTSFTVKDKNGNDPALQTVPLRLEGEVLERVAQYYDWRTAPVKRIDQLALRFRSQRTGRDLKVLPKWKKTKDDATGQQETTSPSEGGGGMMMQRMTQNMGNMKSLGMQGGGTGGGTYGGETSSTDQTKNKNPKDRYVEVSDQVRRMPIGIAVVMDQEFIPDFLTAVANSKLRIQITRVYWQRFHEDIKPKITEDKPADGKTAKAKRTAAPRASGGGAMGAGMGGFAGFDVSRMYGQMQGMRERMMGGRPGAGIMPSGPTVGTAAAEAAEEDLDSNLVELGVHGIASLYEKYPPPPETPTAAANP